MPIITLTTDFGSRDGYVGAMKGVITRLAPDATIIDIAHDIPRGDVAHAAWVVATSTLEFPHDTIHVVVVDPGVGGTRQEVIVQVPAVPWRGQQLYVGPDNGVFAYLPSTRIWTIKASEVASNVSPTFHGRDVFAHAAAALAKGRPNIYGDYTSLTGRLPWDPEEGVVVHIDAFGNLVTNVRASASDAVLHIAGRRIPIARTYEDVAPGEVLAYIGSAGTLEIAVRDGRADTQLGIERGSMVGIAAEGPYR